MLPRLFIKDYDNVDDPKVRNAYGMLASIVGIFWNVLLSVSKIVVGCIFGAVSVLADGLNNLSDAGSALVTMFGFRIANKPADKTHPFGHARVEYVSSMIISFVILFIGLELTISSIEKIVAGGTTEVSTVLMVVLAVSIVVKLLMSIYTRHMSKKIDSTALKAMSIDSFNDSIATFTVLICMIVTKYTGVELDGYVSIAVALFILVSGASLFKETLSPLLGEAPSHEFVEHIINKVRSYEGILDVHDLIVHNYGANKYYASLHAEVNANQDLITSHDLIDRIERDFKAEGYEVVIHLDPIVTDDERVNTLRETVRAKLMEIEPSITLHDFRVVFGSDKKKLIFDIVLPQDYTRSDEDVLAELTAKVREADETCELVVDIDRNYVGV